MANARVASAAWKYGRSETLTCERRGMALHRTFPVGSATPKFRYNGYALSICARNALHADASGERSAGNCANAVRTCRAASICAAWLLVAIRISRSAVSLTLAMVAL